MNIPECRLDRVRVSFAVTDEGKGIANVLVVISAPEEANVEIPPEIGLPIRLDSEL